MEDENKEAKDFDSIADEFLNQDADSSAAEGDSEDQSTDAAGTEPDKTEQVKEIESDDSLSVEDKIGKVKEILGDDEKAIDAYIKEKGYHNDPAWQKREELIKKLREEGEAKSSMSDEDKQALDEFKSFRSSAEYIQTSMKAQGFTQEAIDSKLVEAGFDSQTKPKDDVQLVVSKLGIDLDKFTPQEKVSVMQNIEDIVKVADILVNDRLSKVLPEKLAPMEDHISSITKTDNASKLMSTMKETVKTESILDFEKDIEPELNKYLDDNPDAVQEDIFEHFKRINHKLTVERLKTGKRQEDRDGKKTNLRQNVVASSGGKGTPQKTGSFEKDADAFLDSINF